MDRKVLISIIKINSINEKYKSIFQKRIDLLIDKINNKFNYEVEIVNNENSINNLFKSLKKQSNMKEDIIIIIPESYALLDINNSLNMLENIIKYKLDYFYSEGFPDGINPEIIKSSLLDDLIELSSNNQKCIFKNFIFNILLKNISNYDIDFIEGEENFDLLKFSLTSDKQINRIILDKVIDNQKFDITKDDSYKSISKYISDNLKELRTLPKMIQLEISSECNYNCVHCPYPEKIERDKKYLTLDDVKYIYENNSDITNEAIFLLGGFGEPFKNSEVIEIINYLSNKNEVYIETNGSLFSGNIFEKLDNIENVKLIVSLDAATEELYRKLGKNGNFKKVETFLNHFLENYNHNTFLQFVRMVENEMELEIFYEKWKKYEDNIIFRKYNTYSNTLEQREVADLTPVNRFPCFHLRRDLYILSDGKIAMCKSDINGKTGLNVFDKSLIDIWSELEKYYISHINKQYPQICKDCNEFYTFYF